MKKEKPKPKEEKNRNWVFKTDTESDYPSWWELINYGNHSAATGNGFIKIE